MTPQQATDQPSQAANDELHDVSTTAVAVGLCLSPSIAWSMTPLQLQVFQQLCTHQMADASPHSLLPQVLKAFCGCHGGGWWDVGVADIGNEWD